MSILLSRKGRRRGGGNPLTTPAADLWRRNRELERGSQLVERRRSPAEDFIVGALLDHAADVYVHAHYNKEMKKLVWHKLCQNMNLDPPKYVFASKSISTELHFSKRATMVLEESLCSISTALADRWVNRRTAPAVSKTSSTRRRNVEYFLTPQENLSFDQSEAGHRKKCHPMKMVLTKRSYSSLSEISFFKFRLPGNTSGFSKDQLKHLRYGTIVECKPTNKVGLTNVLLGAICNTNRAHPSKSRSFVVMISTKCHFEHLDSKEWQIQPLTSLVSEMRQLEACQLILSGQVQPPFLHLINGRERDMEILSQQEQEQQANQTGPRSLMGGVELHSGDQRSWNIPELNAEQEKAATKFINSKSGTISLVQGPPGTGKSTFLVSTLCRCLLKSLQEEEENQNSFGWMANGQAPPTSRPLLVSAPSNKAVLVLASRFLAAIGEDDGREREIRIVLLGDEEKLIGESVSSLHSAGTANARAQAQSQVTTKHVFVHKFLANLVSLLETIGHQLQTNVEEGIIIGQSHAVFRMLAQLTDVGCFFQAGVQSRVVQLRDALLGMTARKRPEPFNRTALEHALWLAKALAVASRKNDLVYKVTCALVRSADVIFCTLASSGCNIFKQKETLRVKDLIVDEAAAATEPELAIPFHLEPDRLLVVGDPMQLPATVLSPMAKIFGLEKSLHQRLMNECNFPYTMLKKQYRMRKEIVKFPSKHFYRGKLKNGGKVKKSTYRSDSPVLEPWQDPVFFQNVRGKEKRQKNGSYQNKEEAKAVLDWICKLKAKASGRDPNWFRSDKVRIITFYHAQVELINGMLGQIGYGTVKSGLVAATVDSSQGCEADLVIVSFVRTCYDRSGTPRAVAGFLTEDQRINVALTRAKFELICIGDAENMSKNPSVGTLQLLASEALLRQSIGRKRKPERKEPKSKKRSKLCGMEESS